MYDTTIHAKTIGRQFKKRDFHSKVWTAKKDDRPAIIRAAKTIAENGFGSVSFKTNKLGGKWVYRHASLAEALLIRHVSESVRRITGVRQSDRQSIVKSLSALLCEGVSYNVAKIDIKSFYESIDPHRIVSSLEADPAFSRQAISVLRSFFEQIAKQGIEGLPRGIGLSATLSEYLMRPFDNAMRSLPGMKFYSRYVDDIIIVCSSELTAEDAISKAESLLPLGLVTNKSKTQPYVFKKFSSNNTGSTEQSFSFLGYSIKVSQIINQDRLSYRSVDIDISPKKVDRIKRRICKCLLRFNSDASYADLNDRIKIMTSNFSYKDDNLGIYRHSGIKYNYILIDPHKSESLKELDRFLRNIVSSKHPNNRIRPDLTRLQRSKLLSFGFKKGFVSNRFYTFDRRRLERLVGCWTHA